MPQKPPPEKDNMPPENTATGTSTDACALGDVVTPRLVPESPHTHLPTVMAMNRAACSAARLAGRSGVPVADLDTALDRIEADDARWAAPS
jgi:hypothetical protein